jgi:hypothetical protein
MDWFITILLVLLFICCLLLAAYLVIKALDDFNYSDVHRRPTKEKKSTNALINIIHLHNLIRGGF